MAGAGYCRIFFGPPGRFRDARRGRLGVEKSPKVSCSQASTSTIKMKKMLTRRFSIYILGYPYRESSYCVNTKSHLELHARVPPLSPGGEPAAPCFFPKFNLVCYLSFHTFMEAMT